MRIWIGNMAPGSTNDGIEAFIKKYSRDLECSEIKRDYGDSSHPVAIIAFARGISEATRKLALRVHGMYCKERQLTCNTLVR